MSCRRERPNNKDQSRNLHCECWWPKVNHAARLKPEAQMGPKPGDQLGGEGERLGRASKDYVRLLCEPDRFVFITLSLICN